MDTLLRVTTLTVLVAILMVQIAILMRMPSPPPTMDELRSASADEKTAVLMRRPLVLVAGSIEVDGTVDVNVENAPLQVEVD